MRNFTFFHCYVEELWEGYEKNGLIRENFGIHVPQSIDLPPEKKFNLILNKEGKLYKYIKENKCFLYIDRLQGGTYIDEYEYDEELINEYRDMLDERFLGFQFHEWLSNYKTDVKKKLADLPEENWTEEEIKKMIFKKFPYPHLFLEAMTAKELAQLGKPKTLDEFYNNMTSIYKKRGEKYQLLPCDSYLMMYPFEAENGAKVIMPEVGAQIVDMRLQMCFVRGVSKSYKIKFGAYYEPWGGEPFTTCAYFKGEKNEWGIEDSADFPFLTGGVNGGSSRSLQWRVYLYAYLSGADLISEEWGGYNTFTDETYALSEYGLVKKKFLDFVDRYPDIGDKVAPIAAVISNRLPCFTLGEDDTSVLFGYPLDDERARLNAAAKNAAKKIFQNAVNMQGMECETLINSNIPDAVDMLNEGDGSVLGSYQYLVDMTGEDDFKERYANCISPDEVEEKLYELLPCRVDGGFHYLLNESEVGYYLSIFNHSGIVRTQAEGESVLSSATKTATITVAHGKKLVPLEGNTDVRFEEGKYSVELNGGDWLFAKIL